MWNTRSVVLKPPNKELVQRCDALDAEPLMVSMALWLRWSQEVCHVNAH